MLIRLSGKLKAASFLLGSPSGFYNLAKPSPPYSKPGPEITHSWFSFPRAHYLLRCSFHLAEWLSWLWGIPDNMHLGEHKLQKVDPM